MALGSARFLPALLLATSEAMQKREGFEGCGLGVGEERQVVQGVVHVCPWTEKMDHFVTKTSSDPPFALFFLSMDDEGRLRKQLLLLLAAW